MPTPCPSRLKELIALANREPDSEAHKHLQAIAHAFQAKRWGDRRVPDLQLEIRHTITVLVADGTVQAPRNQLALALNQIDPPSNIDRIRECPKISCSAIFWAGRSDKEACDLHTVAWSKREWRRKQKSKKAEREKRAAARVKKPVKLNKLSKTAWAVISAIMNQRRVFYRIDSWVVMELRGEHARPPSRRIVRNCLDMLVKVGYLDYYPHEPDDPDEPPDPLEDRWAPTQTLKNRLVGVRRRPTH